MREIFLKFVPILIDATNQGKTLTDIQTIVFAAFGLLSFFFSSSVIIDWFENRAKKRDYVLFVVWANLICS